MLEKTNQTANKLTGAASPLRQPLLIIEKNSYRLKYTMSPPFKVLIVSCSSEMEYE